MHPCSHTDDGHGVNVAAAEDVDFARHLKFGWRLLACHLHAGRPQALVGGLIVDVLERWNANRRLEDGSLHC